MVIAPFVPRLRVTGSVRRSAEPEGRHDERAAGDVAGAGPRRGALGGAAPDRRPRGSRRRLQRPDPGADDHGVRRQLRQPERGEVDPRDLRPGRHLQRGPDGARSSTPCTRAGRGRATPSPPTRASGSSPAASCCSTRWSPTSCGTRRRCPTCPGPDAATPNPSITVFPGAEARLVDAPDAVGADGSPAMYFWTRHAGVVRLGGRQPGHRRLDPARLHHRPGHAPALRTSTSPTRTRRSRPV